MVIAAVWLRAEVLHVWSSRLVGQEGPSDRRGTEPCQIIHHYSLPTTYRCTVFRFHRAEVCVCKLRHLKSFVKIHLSSVQARPVCN